MVYTQGYAWVKNQYIILEKINSKSPRSNERGLLSLICGFNCEVLGLPEQI
jgi:hypothetical protein